MNIEFTFKTVWRSDEDDWHPNGPAITEIEILKKIKNTMVDRIVVVEHHHYRGSCAPDRMIMEDYEKFIEYLKKNAIAGDSIWIFDITDTLADGKELLHGKCPDERGQVPRKGAY